MEDHVKFFYVHIPNFKTSLHVNLDIYIIKILLHRYSPEKKILLMTIISSSSQDHKDYDYYDDDKTRKLANQITAF